MRRVEPGPGQESVWDYPRPPRVEATDRHIRVEFGGEVIADSTNAMRVLETSHPPVYYLPPDDCRMDLLRPSQQRTFCEFKGVASYWSIVVGDRQSTDAAWSYPEPSPGFERLVDHLAFYPSRVDRALVDGLAIEPQEGDFYGGWITPDVVGPFKGAPGTRGW